MFLSSTLICFVLTIGQTFSNEEDKNDFLNYQFDQLPDKSNMTSICLKFVADMSYASNNERITIYGEA